MYLNNCILLYSLITTNNSIIIIIPAIINSTSNINDTISVSSLVHSEYVVVIVIIGAADPIQE